VSAGAMSLACVAAAAAAVVSRLPGIYGRRSSVVGRVVVLESFVKSVVSLRQPARPTTCCVSVDAAVGRYSRTFKKKKTSIIIVHEILKNVTDAFFIYNKSFKVFKFKLSKQLRFRSFQWTVVCRNFGAKCGFCRGNVRPAVASYDADALYSPISLAAHNRARQ